MSVSLQSVCKAYGNHKILSSLDLHAANGCVTAVLGANGAGKTTAIRLIAGILKADSGKIFINGSDAFSASALGYLPELSGFYWSEPILDQILYFAELRSGHRNKGLKMRAKALAEKLGVGSSLEQTPGRLSKGTVQRLQFVSAMLLSPSVLLLDEPFSGLDPIALDLVTTAARDAANNGATVLMSTHRMEALDDLCERFFILREGRVALDVLVEDLRDSPRMRTLRVSGTRAYDLAIESRAEIFGIVGETIDMAFTTEAAAARIASLIGRGITSLEVIKPTISDLYKRIYEQQALTA